MENNKPELADLASSEMAECCWMPFNETTEVCMRCKAVLTSESKLSYAQACLDSALPLQQQTITAISYRLN